MGKKKKYVYKSGFGLRVYCSKDRAPATNLTGQVKGHPKEVAVGKKSDAFTLIQLDDGALEVVSICDLIPISSEWPRKHQTNEFWEKGGT